MRIIAALYAVLSQQTKTKGRVRMEAMIKRDKNMDVFSVKNSDMQMFVEKAKEYGILYCVVRDPKGSPDGMTDVFVRKGDAPKVNRIVERFKLSSVENVASVRAEIVKSKAERAAETQTPPEQDMPDKSAEDKLLDELFEKPLQKESPAPENPNTARMEKSPPSEPSLTKQDKSGKGTDREVRPSVREELKAIRAGQEKKQESSTPEQSHVADKPKSQQKSTQHQQPKGKKSKNKNRKER